MEKFLREALADGSFGDVSESLSRRMSRIRSKGNRTTESRLRLCLVRLGVRGWILHPRSVPGRPDFYFGNGRVAIFVDGCFWHGCPTCGHVPKKNSEFWRRKLQRNRERDSRIGDVLNELGVEVIRFWECQLKSDVDAAVRVIVSRLRTRRVRRKKRERPRRKHSERSGVLSQ